MKIKLMDTRLSGRKKLLGIDSPLKKAGGYALRFLAALLLSRIRVFGECSPFALGFTGACGGGIGGAFAAVGTMLGASIDGVDAGIKYSAAALLIYAAAFVFRDTEIAKKRWFTPLLSSLMLACVGAVYIGYNTNMSVGIALFICDIMLTYGSCRIYSAALTGKGGTDGIGLAAFVMSIVMALSRISIADTISIGRLTAAFAVVAVAYSGGAAAGSAAGVALGLALDISLGLRGSFTMILGFAGLFAGLFGKKGRFSAAVAYVLANAVTVLWVMQGGDRLGMLYEAFAVSVIFMLPPESFFAAILPGNRKNAKPGYGAEREREYIVDKVEQAAKAFGSIYSVLSRGVGTERNDNDIAAVFDVAAEKVCRGCKRREHCWGTGYESTKNALNDASAILNIRGITRTEDFPQYFRDSCADFKTFMEAVNTEMKALVRRRQIKKRISEDRKLLYNQYKDMSCLLEEIAAGSGSTGREERKIENRINDYLLGISSGCVCGVFRDRNSRLHVDISGENPAALTRSAGWLDKLSAAAEVRLCCGTVENEDNILKLYQAEPLEVSVGIATLEREGSLQNGDMATWFKSSEGLLYLIISDGMGSGSEAAQDSKIAVNIAEQLLKAGVGAEYVMSILNCAMLLQNEKSMGCASVDLMSINLFTGETHIYKYGAAPSYVRRGSKVETVRGESFAAGLENVAPDITKLRLTAKNAAVIVSDGADNAGIISKSLLSFGGGSVKGLAGAILEDIAAESGRSDDMTVLTVSVDKRA